MGMLFESSLADTVVALATLSLVIYWYATNTFDYWRKRNVPFCKPIPFFGNVIERALFRLSTCEIWKKLYRETEGHKIAGAWVLKEPILFVRDLDVIKRILVKDFAYFHDRGLIADEERNPLTANLFNLGGEKWRSLRTKLTPTFTSGKMKMMFTLMNECSRDFVEYVTAEVHNNNEVEFREVFAKLTTDIIGSCAFGLQFNAMKNPVSEFRAMGRKIFAPSIGLVVGQILLNAFPRLSKFLDVRFPTRDVNDFFMKVVQDTLNYREKNKVIRRDFLQLLVDLKNKEGLKGNYNESKHLSDEETEEESEMNDIQFSDNLLAAQAFVFFLAGFETSSTTMSFALHELTVNVDIQTKLREEIDRVLKESGGEFSYEAIKKMVYLEQVVNESLRKYPPAPVLLRVCAKAYREPDTGVLIDAGTRVIVPVCALHHDPKYFPAPEAFDPDRFSEAERAKRPHFAFLPFGEGPRICIGMRFGMLQAKLGLAALLSRFELSPCGRTQHPLALDPKAFITACKGGVWARVAPRTPGACSLRPPTAALGAQ